ncbi:MAG: hypothetical protein WCW35_14465 [Bacteroidota bacterium]|jgi:hypothetical protein
MIPLLIFTLHIIGLTAVFTFEYQKEGISAGVLAAAFIVLIFSVGWSISSFFLKYLIDEPGFGIWLNRDALSLIILTVAEAIFYLLYFRETPKSREVR